MEEFDVAIIGAGPTGLYAAYYAGFRGFSVAIIDHLSEPGGQISAMYPEKDIFDVAGMPVIKGRDLVSALVAQAQQFSPSFFLDQEAVTLTTNPESGISITTNQDLTIRAKVAIITGGIGSFTPRPLPLGQEWIGKGIEYFVRTFDTYRNLDVVVVGGGDSAFDWALGLQPIAKSVTLVHRRDTFRAHASSVDAAREAGITLLTNMEVTAISGTNTLEQITIMNKETHESLELPAQAVVAALGFVANIGHIADWGLQLEKRRIKVDSAMRTNLPRVFAAGDITVYDGKVPLISVGFGEAATAVNNATPWVDESQGVFPGHSSGGGE